MFGDEYFVRVLDLVELSAVTCGKKMVTWAKLGYNANTSNEVNLC